MKARHWVVLALVAASVANGQVMFERFWGENGWPDCFFSVAQCPDKGYIAAGYTASFGADWVDFWLVRTDSLGQVVWMDQTVTGPHNQEAFDVEPLWDGGFIACGDDFWNGTSSDILLVRYDSSGDTVWTRRFGDPGGGDGAMGVTVSPDSCFVVGSRTSTPGSDLIKVDQAGNRLWGRSYPGMGFRSGFSSVERTNDGYILCGTTLDSVADEYIYLVRTDSSGDTVWTRALRLKNTNRGHRARQTSDGGFIVSGSVCDTSQDADASLLKFNASGGMSWVKTFTQTYLWYNDLGTDVVEEPDGGFVLLALGGDPDSVWPLLIKVDGLGNTVWERRVGSLNCAGCMSVARTGDGGLVMAGGADFPDSSYGDAYLVKTDSLGRLAVAERPAPAVRTRQPVNATLFRNRAALATALSGSVELTVFDVDGRVVHRARGAGRFEWDAEETPVGVYVWRIAAAGGTESGRLLKAD